MKMKWNVESFKDGFFDLFYSPTVALRREQVVEAERDHSFLIREGMFWLIESVKKDNKESTYNECCHWDLKIADAKEVLEICKSQLNSQILQESFWPCYGLGLVMMVVWLQW